MDIKVRVGRQSNVPLEENSEMGRAPAMLEDHTNVVSMRLNGSAVEYALDTWKPEGLRVRAGAARVDRNADG